MKDMQRAGKATVFLLLLAACGNIMDSTRNLFTI